MKNKDSERQTDRLEGASDPTSGRNNKHKSDEGSSDSIERKRQQASNDQEEARNALSKGYFPDGPGGSYSGV